MYCKKCGNPIGDDLVCSACGFQNILDESFSEPKEVVDISQKSVMNRETTKVNEKDNFETKNLERNRVWAWLSGIMFLVSLIPLYKGYDKMTNYYSSDTYYSLNKNAYVGGDAYNYIINASYATAFFVLFVGTALLGIGFLIVYYLSDKKVA